MNWLSSLAVYNSFIEPIIDVLLLTFLLYKSFELVTRTNGVQIITAATFLGLAYGVVTLLNIQTVKWIFDLITPGLIVSFVVVFQPEIRKLFLKLGQTKFFTIGKRSKHTYVDQVLIAADQLSDLRRGMLAVFLRHTKHDNITSTGITLNADLTASLLVTIYSHDTPLHDGACFIQDGKLIAAGCFLPLSEQYDIKKTFGTRHRAALGLCEQSDCIVLVVSEETGAISLAYDSKLHYDLSMEQLTRILESQLEITPAAKTSEDMIDEHKDIS